MVRPRSLQYEDIADAPFNVNWNNIVRLFDLLELAVHQGLIQVKDQSLLPSAMIRLRAKESIISPEARLRAIIME